MRQLIAHISPIRYEHKINIIEDGQILETFTCKTENIINTVRRAAQQYNVDEIAFVGSPNFVREYKDNYINVTEHDYNYTIHPIVKIIQI